MDNVDSRETPLPAPTVLLEAVRKYDNSGYPPEVVVATLAKEMDMPNSDRVQIGNTVYLGHRGKGDNEDLMVGRAFNMDTGEMFVRNGLKYVEYMYRKGIRRYVTQYDGDTFDAAFRVFIRKAEPAGLDIQIHKRDNDKTTVTVDMTKYDGDFK